MSRLDNRWVNGGSDPAFETVPNKFGSNWATAGNLSGPTYNKDGRAIERQTREQALKVFFGTPKYAIEPPASDYDEQENLDLPDAYIGKNSYLSRMLISQITAEELWPISEMFPWRRNDDNLEISWDEWHFNDSMLSRVPEEGVSRLLTSNVSSNRTTMVRFGIALLLEHGFYNTEKGQLMYAKNIQQIKNAIVETAAYGAMIAALESEPYKDRNEVFRNNTSRGRVDLDAYFREELETWAILQKTEHGPSVICNKLKNTLAERNSGRPGNYFVMPNGVGDYVLDKVKAQPYAVTGFRFGEGKDLMAAAVGSSVYRESRSFRMGEHKPNHDPCFREQTIGTFFTMNDAALDDVLPKNFLISYLDRNIYDEEIDNWYRFTYRDNIGFTGLWRNYRSDDHPTLSWIGERFFEGVTSYGEYYKKIDRLDYAVATIAHQSIEVHGEFIAGFNRAVQADADGDVHGDNDSYNAAAAARGFNFFDDDDIDNNNNNNRRSRLSQAPKHIKKALLNDGRTVTERSSAVRAIHDIEKKYDQQAATGSRLNYQSADSSAASAAVSYHMNSRLPEARSARHALEWINARHALISTESAEMFTFLSFLERIDKQFQTSNMNTLIHRLSKAEEDRKWPLNLYLYAVGVLGHSLLGLDLLCSLQSAIRNSGTKYGFNLTTLENVRKSAADWRIEDEAELRSAMGGDKKSMQWLASEGADLKLISISTNPLLESPINLPFRSQAFTLSSSNSVLFNLTDDEVANFIASAGHLNLDKIHVEDDDPFQNDHLRTGLLQYSVTLSALFTRMRQEQNNTGQEQNEPMSDEATEANQLLLSDLRSIVSRTHTRTKKEEHLRAAYNMARSFNILFSQESLKYPIFACKELLNQLFDTDLSDSELLESANQVSQHFSAMESLSSSAPPIDFESAEVSGAFSPFNNQIHDLVKSRKSKLSTDAIRAEADEAIKKLSELHAEASNERENLSLIDSFRAFRSSYLELYSVFKAKNWKGWAEKVKAADELFNSYQGSVQATRLVHAFIHDLLNVARNEQREPSVDELKENLNIRLKERQDKVTAMLTKFQDLLATYQYESIDAGVSSPFAGSSAESKRNRNELYTRIHVRDPNFNIDTIEISDRTESIVTALFMKFGDTLNGIKAALEDDEFYAVLSSKVSNTDALRNAYLVYLSLAVSSVAEIKSALGEESLVIEAVNETLIKTGISIEAKFRTSREEWGLAAAAAVNAPVADASNQQQTERLTSRQIAEFLMAWPINDGTFIKLCIRYNWLPPVGGLGVRNAQRYLVGSGFHLVAGGECGNTLFSRADFQLGDNVAQKMHYGHFTMYNKTVLWDNSKIVHARNIYVKSYLGGNGTRVWDPLDPDDIEMYRANNLENDIFFNPIPINYKSTTFHLDITGRYHSSLSASTQANSLTHYDSAEIMTECWGWKNLKDPTIKGYYSSFAPQFNTLCFQGHEGMYNSATGAFNRYIIEQGHWGARVYPGCGKVRKGYEPIFRDVNYDGTAMFGIGLGPKL